MRASSPGAVKRSLTVCLPLALIGTLLPLPAATEIVAVPEVVSTTVPVSLAPTATSTGVDGAAQVVVASAPITTAHPFTMVGFELPDGIDVVEVRTRDEAGAWSPWYELDRYGDDDGPDADAPHADLDRSARFTEPAWVGPSEQLQVRVPVDEADRDGQGSGEEPITSTVEATILDTEGSAPDARTRRRVQITGPVAEAASRPGIVSRSAWGAAAPTRGASYAARIDLTVVHHTAGSNNYTRAQAPGRVRGYQAYHRNTLNWGDIGYNALIDRYGTIYEGRAGGLDRSVVGAHARGYNTGSFGVSVMGNFEHVDAPQAAYDALVRVIAWKAAIHRFDPAGTTDRAYGGSRVRSVVGHREVGQTACPGRIQNRMGWIRTQAAARRGPLPPDVRLWDVPVGSIHRDNVVALDRAGIIGGYQDNTYRPANDLTRGQMATIVGRAKGLPAVAPGRRFRDVDAATPHAGAIGAVSAAGIVGGFRDGTFRPGEPVTRGQMATFLARSLDLDERRPRFADVPASHPHAGSIGAIQEAGITNGGADGRYQPAAPLRRDQAASLIARAFDIR